MHEVLSKPVRPQDLNKRAFERVAFEDNSALERGAWYLRDSEPNVEQHQGKRTSCPKPVRLQDLCKEAFDRAVFKDDGAMQCQAWYLKGSEPNEDDDDDDEKQQQQQSKRTGCAAAAAQQPCFKQVRPQDLSKEAFDKAVFQDDGAIQSEAGHLKGLELNDASAEDEQAAKCAGCAQRPCYCWWAGLQEEEDRQPSTQALALLEKVVLKDWAAPIEHARRLREVLARQDDWVPAGGRACRLARLVALGHEYRAVMVEIGKGLGELLDAVEEEMGRNDALLARQADLLVSEMRWNGVGLGDVKEDEGDEGDEDENEDEAGAGDEDENEEEYDEDEYEDEEAYEEDYEYVDENEDEDNEDNDGTDEEYEDDDKENHPPEEGYNGKVDDGSVYWYVGEKARAAKGGIHEGVTW